MRSLRLFLITLIVVSAPFVVTPFALSPKLTGGLASSRLSSHGFDPAMRLNSGGILAQPSGSGALPVAVDGAKTPELIPDSLAFRHFLMVLALSAAATPEEVARRNVLLKRAGLSPVDNDRLLNAIASVNDELSNINQQESLWSINAAPGRAALDDLRRQQGLILDEARTRLIATLSADGVTSFDRFVVGHVKRHIIVYGAPPVVH
jgi:hypothetical protein